MKAPAYIVAGLAGLVVAHPGMDKTLREIQQVAPRDGEKSMELLGNLKTLPDRQLTKTGRQIKDLLQDKGEPEDRFSIYIPPFGGKDGALCRRDTCCIWKYISDEMWKTFRGSAGRCNNLARGAVRLGFHDAGVWSKTKGGGGADGSILLTDELDRPDNNGLQPIAAKMREWHAKYRSYGVGMADLIQFGATVATVTCPLGPRIRTYVGRVDRAEAGPEGLLPSPFQSADELIAMFRDKTISPHGLVALVGAHTTSQQAFVDPSRAGDPQDSTPGVWDVKFYGETTARNPPKKVFKFPSDVALSQHPLTRDEWKEFTPAGSGQRHWNEDYAREYIRLSLLGVDNINGLTECTKVLPNFMQTLLPMPDQGLLDRFLNGTLRDPKKAADQLLRGDNITQ